MVQLGMDINQSLALPVKVKVNNLSFFWFSVTVAHKTDKSHKNGSGLPVGSWSLSRHTGFPSMLVTPNV